MQHEEYVKRRHAGTIELYVKNEPALNILPLMPARYRYAHNFWHTICFLMLPISIAVGYFYHWAAGLAAYFIAGEVLRRSVLKSLRGFVVDCADTDPHFFRAACVSGALEITPLPDPRFDEIVGQNRAA